MQRTSPRASLIGLALVGGLIAAMLLFILTMGGQGTPKAQAIVPTKTNTPGPPPTPKVPGTGNLTGLFDVEVPLAYNCIVRTDEDAALNIKSAAQCYTQLAATAPGAEQPCDAKHGIVNQAAKTTPGATPTYIQATPKPLVRGEGTCSADVANLGPHPDQSQMPPPPPYTAQLPTKSLGAYCPGAGCIIPGTGGPALAADTSYTVGCFADIGGTLGPNVIAVTQIPNNKTQDPGTVTGLPINGTVWLWLGATNAVCTAAQAGTAPGAVATSTTGAAGAPLVLTRRATTRIFCSTAEPVGNCPIQTSAASTCTDMVKLWQDKAGSATKCGDDPFNPFDAAAEGATPIVDGNYDITAEALRSDVVTSGIYYSCKAVIKQGPPGIGPTPDLTLGPNDLTGKVLCYVDSPLFAVNQPVMNAAQGPTCPVIFYPGSTWCGDGVPGAAPPGCNSAAVTCAALAPNCTTSPCNVSQYQFANISTKHTLLTGTLANNTMNLTGCFNNPNNSPLLGNVYLQAKINAHTGAGEAIIYPMQTSGTACKGAGYIPSGGGGKVQLVSVRQNPMSCKKDPNNTTCAPELRDSDGDGCPDQMELGDNQNLGGLRDPLNRWDYFNPEKKQTPNTQPVADILAVIKFFGHNQHLGSTTNPTGAKPRDPYDVHNPVVPPETYNIDYDRTGILGANPWNLGPPDGQVNVVDILIAIKQFGHSCAKAKP